MRGSSGFSSGPGRCSIAAATSTTSMVWGNLSVACAMWDDEWYVWKAVDTHLGARYHIGLGNNKYITMMIGEKYFLSKSLCDRFRKHGSMWILSMSCTR